MKEMEGRNYQILNTIATGGTAVLYRAIQTSLDRQVVIKKLHSHLTSDKNFTGRFELEAKAAASLDHENIVRIIDTGISSKNYYIVMEYIDGITLKDLLDKYHVVGEEITLLIAREICIGLDHAHQRGIIHRDIKPANIMITNEGQVKITDFGLAKLHQSQMEQTVASTLLGTPLYMSPEQAIGDGVDGRSDIFSLGTVCYEMMTGIQPFMGSNYAAVIQKIISGVLTPPSGVNGEVSDEAGALVMKALNRDPAKRFRTAIEMARAIEEQLGQDKVISAKARLRRLVSGDGGVLLAGSGKAVKKRGRRKWLLPLATGLVAAASIAYIAMNPEGLDIARRRISALSARNPLSPEDSPVLTAYRELSADPPVETPGIDSTLNEGTSPPDTAASPAVESNEDAALIPGSAEELEPFQQADEESPKMPGRGAGTVPAAEEKPEEAAPQEEIIVQTTGFIDIQVEPEAEITIDGIYRLSGNRYGPIEIEEGEHTISCRQTDFRDYTEAIVIRKGELSRRRITLLKKTGYLDFDIEDGINVFINGKFTGTTPLSSPILLPTGKHMVDLKKTGFASWSNKVFVNADETIKLRVRLVSN